MIFSPLALEKKGKKDGVNAKYRTCSHFSCFSSQWTFRVFQAMEV